MRGQRCEGSGRGRSPIGEATAVRAVAAALALLASGLSFGLDAAPAWSAEASPPSVRLLAASPKVTVQAQGQTALVDPGVFVAAVGGDFELRASRPSYRAPIDFRQVDSQSGAVVRQLPSRLARGFSGLRRFAQVTVRDRRGRVVGSNPVDFCPNGARQRLNGEGPTLSRYPELGGCFAFPFTKGMVWGIDRGWAASAGGQEGPLALRLRGRAPSGRYTVTVRIAARYRKLFAIPARDASMTLAATLKRVPERTRRRAVEARGAGAASSEPRRGPAVATVTTPDPSAVPDLAALPGHGISMANRRGRSVLNFNSTSWNAGPAPLVIEGFRRRGSAVMDAYQYFHDADGEPVGRTPVGTMKYHAAGGHNHWHLLQFAQYDLLDASKRTSLRGRKQSFCLVPTDAVDLTLPGAMWATGPMDLDSACGEPSSIWIRETLPAGWGDTYPAGLEGQSFDVTRLRNGRYHLRTRVNPLGTLNEQTKDNNVATRTIRLSGKRGKRRVAVSPWQGIRE